MSLALHYFNPVKIQAGQAAPRKCLNYRTPHEVFFDLPLRPLN
jgi:hypothetical protein